MSSAFGFGRARVVRWPGKGMPTLHASAVRLPGPGARRVHWRGQPSPGGRQTEADLSGLRRKQGKRGVVCQGLASSHPPIHAFIQQIFIRHVLGAKLHPRGGGLCPGGDLPQSGPSRRAPMERQSPQGRGPIGLGPQAGKGVPNRKGTMQ